LYRDFDDMAKKGQREHRGKLDLSAYALAHDPCYLGINGQIVLGKSWGQDSSNVQATMNLDSYVKRIYYRPENAVLQSICANTGTLYNKDDYEEDGYNAIKKNLEEYLLTAGKPKTTRAHSSERFTFFNCETRNKYDIKGTVGAKSRYNFNRITHRSTRNELTFLASLYNRKDIDTVI
jgi:hypothetical protein